MRIVALDIGGTAIKSAVWDGASLSECREAKTDAAKGGAFVMERAKAIIASYGSFDAIGISTAGQVDTTDGSIYHANDNIPGYTGTPVAGLMREAFSVPVAVENDVNAAALGEMAEGAAKGLRDFLCLTYGTGVGGAIVLDGKLCHGSSYSGGGFGGIVVHPECVMAGVEFSGCYEKYASATALVQSAKELDPSLDNGRAVFDAADRPEVASLIDRWTDEIVTGLVTLVHIFNPSDIILGGGVMARQELVAEVERRLKKSVAPGFDGVRLRAAGLSNSAGLMGAAYLAASFLNKELGKEEET